MARAASALADTRRRFRYVARYLPVYMLDKDGEVDRSV
jgi:hypothetical protein